MEKYIYILVAVIWFISGIYKAVKKGQQQQAPGKKPGRKKSVLETKLDEILREALNEKEKKPMPQPVPSPVKEYRHEKPLSQELIVDETAMSSENMFTEAISLESAQQFKKTDADTLKIPEIIHTESEKTTWNFFGTDLKSIFVFSEIIGKPKALSS